MLTNELTLAVLLGQTEECKDFALGHCLRGERCSFLHPGVDDPVEIEAIRRASAHARGNIAQLNRYLGLGQSSAQTMRPCSFYATPQGCTKGQTGQRRRRTHAWQRVFFRGVGLIWCVRPSSLSWPCSLRLSVHVQPRVWSGPVA